MKNLTLIILLLLVTKISFAQSHDMRPGSTCKLIKTSVNTESMICPACAANDKKEKNAKNAEIKRRNDKIWADTKAKKDADDKTYRNKVDKENAEKKRKEEQAIADKKASDELRKKYQEIANKGLVKTDVKGEASSIELKNIEGFEDKNRKVYGFKFEGKEVATFPFIEDVNYVNRIINTNFFEVRVFKKEGKYNNPKYKYSIIIDYLGNKMKIENNYQFVRIGNDEKNSVVYLYGSLNSPEYIKDVVTMGRDFNDFYDNRESAIAKINNGWTSMGFSTKFYIHNVTRYTLDFNLKILKKDTGWIIGQNL
jgi:Skp family chaperone for outer membrane proteins